MIVLSESLVLSEVDDAPEGTPWIGYHNLVLTSNIDSTTEASTNPVTNLANPATHLFWLGGTNTALNEYVTLHPTNFGDDIDYLAIAAHNLGSENFTVSVEGKLDEAPDSPDQPYLVLVGEQQLPDDSPTIFRWEPQPLTHVRLRMQGGDDVPRIAVMYVGKLLVLERSIIVDANHVPLKFGRRNTIYNGMSESGNFLGRLLLKEFRESVAEFEHFTPDWFRENFDPFLVAAKTIPFFYAWKPVQYPLESGYAWLTNDAIPSVSPVTDRFDVTLEMRGVA